MDAEPLIYTNRGNLPLRELVYSTHWEFSPESIVFIEEHRDQDGEIVRRAVHVHMLSPLEFKTEMAEVS